MRVLVVGSHGQVGHELMRAEWPAETTLVSADLPDVDIAIAADVERLVREAYPELVVNVAAYTAVDRAESEPERAAAVNETGARNVATACNTMGARCVHFSTDYVFDGMKDGAWTEDDQVAPLSVYGATKEAGERAVRAACANHVIVRTSWVYGADGLNFVKTILRLQRERDVLRIVADQHGCPTSASELADAVVRIAATDASGTYHVAGLGEATWHDVAVETVRAGISHGLPERRVDAIGTADYPTPARRPRNSVLDCARAERTFGIVRRPWRESVTRVVDTILTTEERR